VILRGLLAMLRLKPWPQRLFSLPRNAGVFFPIVFILIVYAAAMLFFMKEYSGYLEKEKPAG
jgi:hypothetical protein